MVLGAPERGAHDPKYLLKQLIAYYLRCLEVERRHDVDFSESDLGRTAFPLDGPLGPQWSCALANHPNAATQCAAVATKQGAPVMLWLLLRRDRGPFRPVVGVFGTVRREGFLPEPDTIHVERPLDNELPEEQLIALRDALERAIREGPQQFERAVLSAASDIHVEDLTPEALTNISVEADAYFVRGLMVVQAEARYDRGLVRELNEMEERARAHEDCALQYLLDPRWRVQNPDLKSLLTALANPVTPTFSQAEVIAKAFCNPLLTVTGPPGTGKTRTIVGLIVEALLRRQSVLVASKINFAVDAAVALAERLLGPILLRTGSDAARNELVLRLGKLSHAASWPTPIGGGGSVGAASGRGAIERFLYGVRCLKGLATKLAPCRFPLRWWNLLSRSREKRFLTFWEQAWQQAEILRTEFIPNLRRKREAELRNRLDSLLASARPYLSRLANALSAGSRERQRTFETLAKLGFPIAVTNLAVSSNIPFKKGLFDLLIIDEASACDPASILPLLYRAKRAVIVGDPKQLTHIYQKNVAQVVPVPSLRSPCDTDFSASFQTSSFEIASQLAPEGAQLKLLDHFRCPPEIIAFSSRHFYGSELRIRTSDTQGAIEMHEVQAPHRWARGKSRTNPGQVEVACQILETFAQKYPNETLGVVTPYRAFKEDVRESIANSPQLKKLFEQDRLIADTAHGFQGTEVDNLVFATVIADPDDGYSLQWVEHPNLFNVAITRARKRLVIVTSRELAESPRSKLLRPLLAGAESGPSEALPAKHTGCHIQEWLGALGLEVVPCNRYRGFPANLYGRGKGKYWAIRLTTWTQIQQATADEAFQMFYDVADLASLGVVAVVVPPAKQEEHIREWLARNDLVPGI